MPPRDPPLPEGADPLIDTNSDGGGPAGTATGGGASGGGSTETGTTTMTDTTSGSTGDSSAFQFNEGRSSATDAGDAAAGKTGVGKAADTIVSQLKEQVSTLRSTAGDRARSYAVDGKQQATGLLNSLAEIIQDATGSVEQRLGSQYAGFGARAADSVSSLAHTLDERDIDDLIDDARAFVRRSPAVAIGVAALVGFVVARIVRSGVSELTGEQDGAGGAGTTGGSGPTTSGTANAAMGSGGGGATGGGFGEQGLGTAGTPGGAGTGAGNGTGSNAPTR